MNRLSVVLVLGLVVGCGSPSEDDPLVAEIRSDIEASKDDCRELFSNRAERSECIEMVEEEGMRAQIEARDRQRRQEETQRAQAERVLSTTQLHSRRASEETGRAVLPSTFGPESHIGRRCDDEHNTAEGRLECFDRLMAQINIDCQQLEFWPHKFDRCLVRVAQGQEPEAPSTAALVERRHQEATGEAMRNPRLGYQASLFQACDQHRDTPEGRLECFDRMHEQVQARCENLQDRTPAQQATCLAPAARELAAALGNGSSVID